MLPGEKALNVSIYISEGSLHHGVSRYSSIIDFLFFRGVAGATVLKVVAGFGADYPLHSSGSVDISEHLPLRIEFIESEERVRALLEKLEELAGSGMIEVQQCRTLGLARAIMYRGIEGFGASARNLPRSHTFHLQKCTGHSDRHRQGRSDRVSPAIARPHDRRRPCRSGGCGCHPLWSRRRGGSPRMSATTAFVVPRRISFNFHAHRSLHQDQVDLLPPEPDKEHRILYPDYLMGRR